MNYLSRPAISNMSVHEVISAARTGNISPNDIDIIVDMLEILVDRLEQLKALATITHNISQT